MMLRCRGALSRNGSAIGLAIAVLCSPALDERRPLAPGVRIRDLDHVEVARDDRVRKHLSRLLRELWAEVAAGQVGEREQLHTCDARELGGGQRGRMECLC